MLGDKLVVAQDVFVKQEEDSFIVYSPLSGRLSVVTQELLIDFREQRLTNFKYLTSTQERVFIEAGFIIPIFNPLSTEDYNFFKPTQVTLFPTSNCNLRCVYCYGLAGEVEIVNLDIDVAKHSIDFVVINAPELGKDNIRVLNHGSGEPTHNWNVFKETIEYAKIVSLENNLRLDASTITNGVHSDKRIKWLIDNLNHISVSVDGPPNIQDKNRPLSNGGSSSPYVEYFIQSLVENRHDFGVRATITSESVHHMKEIYEYFTSLGINSISLEPLFMCGRCHTSKVKAPNPEDFVNNYIELEIRASKEGINLSNSLAPFNKIVTSFCGATGKNFCVTPEGFISSCYEVGLQSDPASEIFFYGAYNSETEEFEVDEKKRLFLQSRTLNSLEGCQDCYVKWNCGGECLVKSYRLGDINTPNSEKNDRCKMQRLMAEARINYIVGGIKNE